MPYLLLFALLLLLAPTGRAQSFNVALEPVDGGSARGTATVQEFEVGTRFVVLVQGASDGLHGLAVVEAASCDDASAAHFDRGRHPHGDPEDPRPLHHLGDLGNVRVDDGTGRLDRIFTDLRLDGPNSIAGRLLVLYAGHDDLNSQPDGGAGEPIACGVLAAGGSRP